MPWVISEPCIDLKDRTCVDVCPVDCIYEVTEPGRLTTPMGASRIASPGIDDRMLYIEPNECIDCGVCEPVCPVEAIFEASSLPRKWREYADTNRVAFAEGVAGAESNSPGTG